MIVKCPVYNSIGYKFEAHNNYLLLIKKNRQDGNRSQMTVTN
jgi:hypothetical protein